MEQKQAKLMPVKQARKEVSPYLFSHFAEDIRDHVGCMMAYPLTCMDFECEAVKEAGISDGWKKITNGKGTVYQLEPAMRYHCGHSQMIRLFSEDDSWGGIAQTVSLKQGSYLAEVFARATEQIPYLEVGLYTHTGERIDSIRIEGLTHRFQRYVVRLRADRDYEKAEFVILADPREKPFFDNDVSGRFWIDHASLLAENHMELIDRDVYSMIKGLHPRLLRLAGNYISAYHWEDFVGPVLERAGYVNEVWGGQASRYFGTDEFLRMCESLQCEAMICLNVGSGTVEEALGWIEYCIGDPETYYGSMRSKNGHPNPYPVSYWEIGNEIWGEWQMGSCSAEVYAEKYLEYYRAIKARYPELTLLACGSDRPQWNEMLLSKIHGNLDQLSIHYYHGFVTMPKDDRAGQFTYMVSMAEAMGKVIEDAEALLKKYSACEKKICITEYNTMYYNMVPRRVLPFEHTMEAAAANAGCLNEFLRRSDRLMVCNFSDLVNGWLGGLIRVGDFYCDQTKGHLDDGNRCVYGTASYEVLKLYGETDLQYSRKLETVCGCYDGAEFPENAFRPEFSYKNLPEIDGVSGFGHDGTIVYFLTNRSLSVYRIKINDEDIRNRFWRMDTISAEDIHTYNTARQPDRIQRRTMRGTMQEETEFCLPPCSVNRILFCTEGGMK